MIDVPMPVAAHDVLEEWCDEALDILALPSGRSVKVRPGSLMELAVAGLLPAPLMAVVVGGEGASAASVDTTRGLELLRATVDVSAAAVRQVLARDGAWVTVTLDIETFLRLPAADRSAITRVALGDSFAEAAASLATFRDEPAGDGPRDDGADVRSAAQHVARDHRAPRRARPRPGAGA